MPPLASDCSIPHPFEGNGESTWRQSTLHVLPSGGIEKRIATSYTLSALEEGVDSLARKFGDEVRALLHHHLQHHVHESDDHEVNCIQQELSQHWDEHAIPPENGHEPQPPLSEGFRDESERLPSLPVKPMRTTSVAKMVKEGGTSSAPPLDECLFEPSRERALASQTRLQRITRSQYYEWASGVLIAANAAFIGIQTELQAQLFMDAGLKGAPLPASEHPLIIVGSALFTIFFTIDLGLRWVSEGLLGLFRSSDCSWSVFDLIIVTISLVDSFFALVTWASGSPLADTNVLSSISALRILRVARIVKLAKVIRLMSFFRELRVMIYSILGSMKSLLWLALILGMTFYIFGITFTSGTHTYLKPEQLWAEPSNEGLRDCFGTLSRSLLTLYMAMAGGRSWGEYYFFLDPIPVQYRFIFLAFLTFTMFAVLNIVTGVFVDSAMRANSNSRQVVIHEELNAKNEMLMDLQNLFHEMDENGDGAISMDEFTSRLGDERVVAYFKALKLDVHDAVALFHLLDTDGSEEVDMAEFLDGCYQLQGEARSIDTKVMRLQLHWIVQHLEILQNTQSAHTAAMSQLLSRGSISRNRSRLSSLSRNGIPSRTVSDPAMCSIHARQTVELPDTGTASGDPKLDRELVQDQSQFMPGGHSKQATRVAAIRPVQRVGLLDAHKQAVSASSDAADSLLHTFLSQETNRERAWSHLNGRQHKARIDAFLTNVSSNGESLTPSSLTPTPACR